MQVLKTLSVPLSNETVEIRFGVPTTSEEVLATQKLRYKIYAKYGYLDLSQYEESIEKDSYDENREATYFAAFIGERPIAFIRVIQSDVLPIEKNFSFNPPNEIRNIPRSQVVELGRLVIDKYKEGEHFPRNTLLLFLTFCLVEYYQKKNVRIAYSFLKKRLMGKLGKLKMPYTEIDSFELTYPNNGPMAPYFYNAEDPATPAYFSVVKVKLFLEKIIYDEKLFYEDAPNNFSLQKNLYTRFLKITGVM